MSEADDRSCCYCARRLATVELARIHERHFCPLRNCQEPDE